jgi:hypothetical protein
MANYPDGEPRKSPGNVGGVAPDGSAERHTADTRVAKQNFGWVPKAASGCNPGGGPATNIGPSGALWRKSAAAVYTTGDQGKGRKR